MNRARPMAARLIMRYIYSTVNLALHTGAI